MKGALIVVCQNNVAHYCCKRDIGYVFLIYQCGYLPEVILKLTSIRKVVK
jgi:hypothetical protein